MLTCISSVLPLPVALQKASFAGHRLIGLDLVAVAICRVELGNVGVQVGQQLVRVAEVAVEVDLGEEQAEILKILPPDRLGPAGADGLGVADDVLVVCEQNIAGELFALE